MFVYNCNAFGHGSRQRAHLCEMNEMWQLRAFIAVYIPDPQPKEDLSMIQQDSDQLLNCRHAHSLNMNIIYLLCHNNKLQLHRPTIEI